MHNFMFEERHVDMLHTG